MQSPQSRQWKLAWCAGRSIAALAACVVLALGAFWWGGRHSLPRPGGTSLAGTPSLQAEIVAETGRTAIVPGQTVTTTTQRQEVMLVGMHRVVMNHDTSAIFGFDRQGGPQVQLISGELYVEVVPGHRFAVTTENALLTITGTKFDVKACQSRTELTLLKGSVRFSPLRSPDQAVSVTAGHESAIAGQSVPTTPAATDAIAATAWARDLASSNAMARIAQHAETEVLSLRNSWRQPAGPDLDKLDYAAWRDSHRDWFAGQFPWIMKVQALLQRQYAIQTDYVELLMVGGDIWQFQYDPKRSFDQPLTHLDPASIVRLARHYQVDAQSLLRAAGVADAVSMTKNPAPAGEYAESMQRWRDSLSLLGEQTPALDNDIMMLTARAGVYLANTRTAAYLWAKSHPSEVRRLAAQDTAGAPRDGLSISRLAQQAALAAECSQVARDLLAMPATHGCTSRAMDIKRWLIGVIAELTPGAPAWQPD